MLACFPLMGRYDATSHLYFCLCVVFCSQEKDQGIVGEEMKEDQGIKSSTHRDGFPPLGTLPVLHKAAFFSI